MIEHPKGPHVLLTLAVPVMAMDDTHFIVAAFPPGKWVTVGPDEDVFGAMVLNAVADGADDVRREAWANLAALIREAQMVTPPVRIVAEEFELRGRAVTDTERVALLRQALAPVIDWYVGVLAEGEPDDSYLYDSTVNHFDAMHHGIYQTIIEALLPDDVVRAPVKADDE